MRNKPRRSRAFKKNENVIDINEAREARLKKREESNRNRKLAGKNEKISERGLEEKQSARKKVQRNRRRLTYTAIMLIIVAVVGLSCYNIVKLHIEKAKLEEKSAALILEREKLTSEFKNVDNPEYIEQQARNQLRLIKPGEILYVLPEKDANANEEKPNEENN